VRFRFKSAGFARFFIHKNSTFTVSMEFETAGVDRPSITGCVQHGGDVFAEFFDDVRHRPLPDGQ
jgi:hypothetical protein